MPDPTAWTIPANGSVVETFGFLTDIMPSWSGHEQRSRLRVIALETLEFSILCEGREAQLAQSLLYAGHDEILAVPLWQFGSRLTSGVSIGATLLPIADATDVPYRRSTDNGGYALVWRDPFTWELFSVASTSGSGVTTSDTAVAPWVVGDYVFPARASRVDGEPTLRWLTSTVLEARLRFTGEQT